jgi:MFS family permease
MSRKRIVGICCIVWSMTSIVTGNTNSLFVLAAMRALLGVSQAAYEPAAYSFIADEVKKEKLPTANSAIIASLFMGGGLCALNILVIQRVGWRMCLNIMGVVGMAIGALSLVFMKEPERIEESDECKIELENEKK